MGSSCDVVVVSHACVLAENQRTYAELAALGRGVELVVPKRWRNEYDTTGFSAQVTEGLEGHVHPLAVLGTGRPQRHAHLASARRVLGRLAPRAVLIEEEPFSLAAAQWARGARALGVPYGVQVAETLDRALPGPVASSRDRVLRAASLVLARSPGAAELAARWGARGEIAVVPHGVDPVQARRAPAGEFTVAYVGRLVEAKGVRDLLEAAALLEGTARFIVAGDGPLAGAVRAAGANVEALGAVPHARVGEVYDRAHATCVPSRATPTWEEQFGRVVVESLARGVPVVAASSGELPWVLGLTGGGVLVAEGDPAGIAEAVARLARDREAAARLGAQGREGTVAHFTNAAAARQLDELLGALS